MIDNVGKDTKRYAMFGIRPSMKGFVKNGHSMIGYVENGHSMIGYVEKGTQW